MWNAHRIRRQRNITAPHGRPAIMYMAPHLYGSTDHICQCDPADVQNCQEECATPTHPCDDTVFELCCLLMEELNLNVPENAGNGRALYLRLRQEILQLLWCCMLFPVKLQVLTFSYYFIIYSNLRYFNTIPLLFPFTFCYNTTILVFISHLRLKKVRVTVLYDYNPNIILCKCNVYMLLNKRQM